MNRKRFTILICIIVVFAYIGLIGISIYATYSEPTKLYAIRPIIEIRNWGGSSLRIRFPYQDYKYIPDYSNPYEYIKTEAGYDLVIHFSRFEGGEN